MKNCKPKYIPEKCEMTIHAIIHKTTPHLQSCETEECNESIGNQSTGYCSDCKRDFSLTELKHLPETESYIRNFDTTKPETIQGNVDFNTLLCPECYGKRFGDGKRTN